MNAVLRRYHSVFFFFGDVTAETEEGANAKKMAVVWQYFTVWEKDPRYAVCNTCSVGISRGGTVKKSCNTTNLIGHLKNRHEAVYRDYVQADQKRKNEAAKKAPKATGKTLIDTAFERTKQLPTDSTKAK